MVLILDGVSNFFGVHKFFSELKEDHKIIDVYWKDNFSILKRVLIFIRRLYFFLFFVSGLSLRIEIAYLSWLRSGGSLSLLEYLNTFFLGLSFSLFLIFLTYIIEFLVELHIILSSNIRIKHPLINICKLFTKLGLVGTVAVHIYSDFPFAQGIISNFYQQYSPLGRGYAYVCVQDMFIDNILKSGLSDIYNSSEVFNSETKMFDRDKAVEYVRNLENKTKLNRNLTEPELALVGLINFPIK